MAALMPTYDPEPLPSGLVAVGLDQRILVVDQARGNNGNPGTAAAPFKTLKHALGIVQPGDTVLVRNGTYASGQGGPVLTRSGTANNWITIAAWPGERPVIAPAEGSGIRLENVHHVEVRGLVFAGPANTDYGSGVRLANRSHHIRVVGNEIYGWAGGGVSTTDSADVLIELNRVWNNTERSPWQTSGISMYQAWGANGPGVDNVIRWNIVWQNENLTPRPDGQITDGNCVIIDDFRNEQGTSNPAYHGSTLVAANSCYSNGGRGVLVYKADNVEAVANLLFGNVLTSSPNGGELTAAQASNVDFRDNLVVPIGSRDGIYLDRTSNISWDGNIIVSNRDHSAYGGNVIVGPGDPDVPDPVTDFDQLPGR